MFGMPYSGNRPWSTVFEAQNGEREETIRSRMSMYPGFGGAASAGFWKKFYKTDGTGDGSYVGVELEAK